MSSPRHALPLVLTAGLVLAGCGGASGASSSGALGEATTDAGQLSVVAAFYPLQYLSEQVGGDRVAVTGLTAPGAEPHDLELSPQQLVGLGDADVAVVLAGFQPAVDDALPGLSTAVVDVAAVADRPVTDGHANEPADEHANEPTVEHADEPGDEHSDDAEDHAGESAEEHAEHAGDTDPHFWTDPTLMVEAARLVADGLGEADPDGAATYEANLAAFEEQMVELDAEAESAFADCAIDTLVTGHDAFGYFADRYGFEVRPVNGLSPDQEPDARTLAEIADFVAGSDVTTVYTETLVSSAVADTVAAEAGVRTAVLDPLEGLTDASAGDDYVEVMRANIDVVRSGQACS